MVPPRQLSADSGTLASPYESGIFWRCVVAKQNVVVQNPFGCCFHETVKKPSFSGILPLSNDKLRG